MLVRSFLLGLFAAVGVIIALLVADGVGAVMIAVGSLTALGGAAVFGAGVTGWPGRVVRGGVGAVLAGMSGVGAILYFKGRTDWFDWPADSAGDLFIALLVAHAAIPGGVAAAASPTRRGLALALGFDVGIAALWLRGEINPGVLILLGLGAAVGGLVGAIFEIGRRGRGPAGG